MFAHFSLKSKLLSLALFMGICGSAAVGYAIYSMRKLDHQVDLISNVAIPNVQHLSAMNFEKVNAVRHITLGFLAMSHEARTFRLGETKKALAQFEQYMKSYEKLPFLPGEEAISKEVFKYWPQFKSSTDQTISLLEKGTPEDVEKAKMFFLEKTNIDNRLGFDTAMGKLMDLSFKNVKNVQEETERVSYESQKLSTLFAVVSILVGGLLAWFLSRNLANTLTSIAENLSSGADSVAVASKQISMSSSQLSSASTEQASALQETVSAVEEISAMVNKNADGAKNSQEMSVNSRDAAAKGQKTVQDMISALGEISASNQDIVSQIEQTNQEMGAIVKVISEIGEKTKVINDIVFQTKLLSFNASVEAARAGEHGKGFAVVAEEVGGLAQMSGNAANEISKMLSESIERVESMVKQTQLKVADLIEVNRTKTQLGTSKANDCASVLDDLVRNVSSVNDMVGEIALASQEQARGITEITQAMSQMDQTTQQNTLVSQESAEAADQLSRRADLLRLAVQQLSQAVEGQKDSMPAQLAPSAPKNNVIPFKPAAKPAPVEAPAPAVKQASGLPLPSETDPRFRDV